MAFPPKALQIFDKDSAGIFLGLRNAILKQRVTYILGAGVSAAVGAPTWSRLLTDISAAFFEHLAYVRLKRDIPAEKNSISFTSPSNASRALARSLADKNPLLAAQLIQNCVKQKDWNYLIRKLLYEHVADSEQHATRLVARLASLTPNLEGVINFNYDDLFERHLPEFDIQYSVLTDEWPTPERRKTPIYHPHGWLPEGGGRDSSLVLSEGDYLERSQTPFSWSNIIQISAYSSTTAVFIGHSMTDPSLRTLLRSTAKTKISPHFAFLPSSGSSSKEGAIVDSLFDNDLVSMKVKPIRYPVTKPSDHSALWQLIKLLGDSIKDESILYKAIDT